jgi:mycofactocin system creatininase family protein
MRRLLAEMTWPDVAQAVANGMTTVILPLGATEQHGPHLPLGTDTFRAEALAERLASTLPDALVAPALPIGCSDEHSGFAGLLSLDHATLAGVIVDCARRMAAWRVRRLVLLSAHGGNGQALELAAARLSEELPGLQVLVLGSSTTVSDALLAVAEAEGISGEAVGLHAGDGETSEMLCLRPDLVHMERIVPGYAGPMAEVMPRLLEAGLRPVTPTGTLGEASRADGSRGERYLAEQIESYRQRLTRPRDVQQCLPSDAAQCA